MSTTRPTSFADMDRTIYPPNATLLERITAYVEHDMFVRAETLVNIGNLLEECYSYDLEFIPEDHNV